ncbi:MlaD family protein [Conexibacter sp. SYSU D00693]|uniref:MlaD family protein n=1 Tax=Conexibacter sp. SYSU D00693 TaxID=2812560 RepID=UPI00196B47D5|nr:MlaD family protein [Conexibacter sp. SYSU D00693]
MRRVATALVLVAVVVAGVAALGAGGSDGGGREYTVELDNAFGLVEGGDLKVAGVRAGTITEMRLDRATNRALVGIRVDEDGFGALRADVHCESRPQSLVGEYFLDCLPGTARRELEDGARIPVAQTGSTVAPDLVNGILRRPYRERLSLVLGELGAGVAGNGRALNAAVRRAAPALRETNRVLATLARQSDAIGRLTEDADRVIGDLAANRRDVGRFVVEAGETATASAARRDDLAAGLDELPGFLRQLTPSMRALGRAADSQGRTLANLRASARGLTRLLDGLGPLAQASRPAFAAVGRAAAQGTPAVRAAGPVAELLRGAVRGTPELGRNLAIVLEHLDDRDWAVEEDPRSPGGKGYTGLEALLTFVFDQTMATNLYDKGQHYLKIAPFMSNCSSYKDLDAVKEHPEVEAQCGARLGPNPIGLVSQDPTAQAKPARRRAAPRRPAPRVDREAPAVTPAAPAPAAPAPQQPTPTTAPPAPKVPTLQDLPRVIPQATDRLLDFLLGDGR